jgi:hypothetical protein
MRSNPRPPGCSRFSGAVGSRTRPVPFQEKKVVVLDGAYRQRPVLPMPPFIVSDTLLPGEVAMGPIVIGHR